MTWAALLPASLTEWLRIGVTAIIVALAAFMLGQCDGRSTQAAKDAAALDRANAAALRIVNAANEIAAVQRIKDIAVITIHEKDLQDAIADMPDSAPDAVRIRLNCERLRASGQDTAAIPACR